MTTAHRFLAQAQSSRCGCLETGSGLAAGRAEMRGGVSYPVTFMRRLRLNRDSG